MCASMRPSAWACADKKPHKSRFFSLRWRAQHANKRKKAQFYGLFRMWGRFLVNALSRLGWHPGPAAGEKKAKKPISYRRFVKFNRRQPFEERETTWLAKRLRKRR